MRHAMIFPIILAAGCLSTPLPAEAPAPVPSPPWIPDCTIAADVAADPCVAQLSPDEGADLEVSLAAHPTDPDTILLAWTSRLGGRAEIWAAVSQDRGHEWSVSKMRNPNLGADPPQSQRYAFDTVAAFSPSGTALVFYGGESQRIGAAAETHDRMTLASSEDGGKTWSYRLVTEDPGVFLWDAMDFAAAPDSQNMYAVAQSIELRGVWFWRSRDGGTTWTEPTPISVFPVDGFAYWPRVAAGPKGLVVVTAKTGVTEPLVALVSEDDGSSFTRRPLLPNNNGGILIGDPTYVSPLDGSTIVVAAGPRGLQLVLSSDRGATWSRPSDLVLAPQSSTPRWSMAAGDANGQFHALYSRSAEGIWAVDLVSWRTDSSPTVTHLVPDGKRQPRDGAAGDEYGGLAVAADGTVWTAWSDTRFGPTEAISILHLLPAPGPQP